MRHSFRNSAGRSGLLVAALLVFASASLLAQNAVSTIHEPQEAAATIEARALIGLPGIAANSEGTLAFEAKSLRFTSEKGSAEIVRQRIIGVSSGDERVETGGATGRVARMVIPYGGGLALGAVTHKKVGLLTIEFMDGSGAYHGAVFVLKSDDILVALAKLEARPPAVNAPVVAASAYCPQSQVRPNTVRVEMVGAGLQSEFPAEDRVLLYEHLVEHLTLEKTILGVSRAGDRSVQANCAEFTVAVRAIDFKKGNQALRASVGPLGHFVGTTKLSYHLTVSTADGTPIFDQDLKKSEGSDSDSLNVTKLISKVVVKNLKRSRAQLRKTQAA